MFAFNPAKADPLLPAAEVKAAVARHGMALLGINTVVGEPGKDMGLGAVPGREQEFAAAIDQSIAYCLGSGAIAIHAMAGKVPPERLAEGREVLIANLKPAAQKAAAHGLTLLLEPLNQRDAPGYFYSTLEPAAEIIAAVGAPNLKLMFDCYHVGVSQGDILKRLERFMPLVGHIQIAAVPSRAEPDEGEIAYRAVFDEIDRLGYAGWVGAEYKPRAATDAGLGWVKTLGVSL